MTSLKTLRTARSRRAARSGRKLRWNKPSGSNSHHRQNYCESPQIKEVARYAVFEAWLSEFEKWHFDVFDESLKHQNEHSVRGFLHFKLLYM